MKQIDDDRVESVVFDVRQARDFLFEIQTEKDEIAFDLKNRKERPQKQRFNDSGPDVNMAKELKQLYVQAIKDEGYVFKLDPDLSEENKELQTKIFSAWRYANTKTDRLLHSLSTGMYKDGFVEKEYTKILDAYGRLIDDISIQYPSHKTQKHVYQSVKQIINRDEAKERGKKGE